MELKLVRDQFTAASTTGMLFVDGKIFGFVLEDIDRGLDSADPESLKKKEKGRTAIPIGRYRVRFTWSPKYGRDMLNLLDVPAYQGIRIHSGNTAEHTEGCLLPGTKRSKDAVANSRAAVSWLETTIRKEEGYNREVWITITREPAAWAAFIGS